MDSLDLKTANRIIETGLRLSRERNFQPMTFCVLDAGGHVVAVQREDRSSTMRFDIAHGKAWASIALGHSTRFMEEKMAKNRPHFLDSLAAASGGKFIPCMGGVLIRDAAGRTLGAVGVTGDSGENDEAVAVAAIQACGLQAELG